MMTLSVSQHTLFCNVWLTFATINFKLSIADCNTRSVPFNTDCNASKSRSSWREKQSTFKVLGCVQTDATLLTNNSQHCWMLHVASVCTQPKVDQLPILHVASAVACCWMLLLVVAQSLKPVKLFRQQLPTFLLFRDRRNVAQQCWIRLRSSSNIVGATHAHYAWFTNTYGLYPSHDALQVPTLLGVVASVCTPLPTRTQQLPTLLAQQCWELLRPFAHSLRYNVREINLRNIFQHFFNDLLHLL